MSWNLEDVVSSLTDYDVITQVSLSAKNYSVPEDIRNVPIKSVTLINGFLSFIVDDLYIWITEGSESSWEFEVSAAFNYGPLTPIARSIFEVTSESTEVTYLGVNVFYVYLNWNGYCDVTPVGKDTTVHVINPENTHPGTSKSEILTYVGNEKNINLHKQLM